MREVSLKRARTELARVAEPEPRSFVSANAVVFLGGYAADHLRLPAIFAATLVLDIFAFAVLVANIVTLAMLAGLDYDRPLLELVRTFDRARLIRARTTMWTLFMAPVMWPPLCIVAMSALFGADAWTPFRVPWLANVALASSSSYSISFSFADTTPVARLMGGRTRYSTRFPAKSLWDAWKQIAELER